VVVVKGEEEGGGEQALLLQQHQQRLPHPNQRVLHLRIQSRLVCATIWWLLPCTKRFRCSASTLAFAFREGPSAISRTTRTVSSGNAR
jgi:hypothetical protein